MSLNEVNWRNVLGDHKSYPPDVEFLITNKNLANEVSQQKFLCHKLLLAAVSPVFQEQFYANVPDDLFNRTRLVVRLVDCNPAAFEKMLEFIYYQKPYKLNSLRHVEGTEGIRLVLDTMDLAQRFKLNKLVSFCEETAEKTVIVNSQNYIEVQELMLSHKVNGKVLEGICEKFGSVVFTKLSRDRPDLDSHQKREIVESEVSMFMTGLPSQVMNFERLTTSDEFVLGPMSKSPTPESLIEEMSHSGDVVILQEAPKNPCSVQETCTDESDFSLSPGALKRRRVSKERSINSASLLGPFPSPVPTFTFRTEPQPSKSGSDSSSQIEASCDLAKLTALDDLWEPRSTSTPVTLDTDVEGNVLVEASVQVSTKMLKSILKTVAGGSNEVDTEHELFTKDELITLVSRYKDLNDDEKKELFEYVKMLQEKNPQLVRSVRAAVGNSIKC